MTIAAPVHFPGGISAVRTGACMFHGHGYGRYRS
jgi:hypothetical protein